MNRLTTSMASALVAGVVAVAVAVALFTGGAALLACADAPDAGRQTTILEPDYDSYAKYVDVYLARRCGSLDCHGQPGRAYRIYGREGYRLYTAQDGGLISGDQPTTEEETRANFQALVALEPEEMSRLMGRQGAEPNRLLFLRKPLRLERHKGGPSMAEGDPGYRCVVSWLSVPVVRGDASLIAPAERTPMSPAAIGACAQAAAFP